MYMELLPQTLLNSSAAVLDGSDPGPLGGYEGFLLTKQERALARELRPIVLLKTHKTASSTLANLLHRMADWRGMRVMLPVPGASYLGWPEHFPGRRPEDENPAHQYGLIAAHAVWSPRMLGWVRPRRVKRRPVATKRVDVHDPSCGGLSEAFAQGGRPQRTQLSKDA